MRYKFYLGLAVFMVCAAMFVTRVSAADDFPLRAKYPDMKTISTEELTKGYADTVIVDVRSTVEFDVARINSAKHVPISKASFAADLEKVRGKADAAPMAFYCNGHKCAKSYDAYGKAAAAGFSNIFVYDDGIFNWLKANPDKSTLMGETPAPADKIIPEGELKKRMIPLAEFKVKAAEAKAMVIDVREPMQRKVIPDVPSLRNIPLDQLIGQVQKKQFADKHLLVLDAVGKQVEWLQYHLEANGYTDYYFLANGVDGQ
jgi:rhodanese-related sulfurtransferase